MKQTIHSCFEMHAATRPDAVALTWEGGQLSYRDLNVRANRLARRLRRLGAGPESRVGLALDRSMELTMAVLAVLKAGAAWVPLDCEHPERRLHHMIETASVRLVVSDAAHRLHGLPGVELLDLAALRQEAEGESGADVGLPLSDGGLAYVIFTSGSTGSPKGVLATHAGAVNLAAAQQSAFAAGADDRVLMFSSPTFDASVWELAMGLLSGGSLCIVPERVRTSAGRLVDLLRAWRVTAALLPPTLLQELPHEGLPDLRLVLSGGEACPAEVARRWSAGRRFANVYGPTEATVACTAYDCTGSEPRPPIGRSLAGCAVHVLDDELRCAPDGEMGELWIGGAQVTRGYASRPDLTAERFRPDPYAGRPGARMYGTGDVGRVATGSVLEFLGRRDDQVTLRGHRIELGDVESALRRVRGVRHAIAALHGAGGDHPQLVAYYVPAPEGPAAAPEEIRSALERELPAYMIPSVCTPLAELPLTTSGKVDRGALPAPRRDEHGSGSMPPRTEAERRLSEIWSALLASAPVGVDDDFFALGGDSILGIRLVSQLQREYGVDLDPTAVFEAPTVAELSRLLQTAIASRPER